MIHRWGGSLLFPCRRTTCALARTRERLGPKRIVGTPGVAIAVPPAESYNDVWVSRPLRVKASLPHGPSLAQCNGPGAGAALLLPQAPIESFACAARSSQAPMAPLAVAAIAGWSSSGESRASVEVVWSRLRSGRSRRFDAVVRNQTTGRATRREVAEDGSPRALRAGSDEARPPGGVRSGRSGWDREEDGPLHVARAGDRHGSDEHQAAEHHRSTDSQPDAERGRVEVARGALAAGDGNPRAARCSARSAPSRSRRRSRPTRRRNTASGGAQIEARAVSERERLRHVLASRDAVRGVPTDLGVARRGAHRRPTVAVAGRGSRRAPSR